MGETAASLRLVQTLHLFQLLTTRLGPLGGGSPNQIAIDKVLQRSDFFLLLFIVLGFSGQLLLLLDHKGRVIADIAIQRMLGQVQRNGRNLIRK